MVFKEYEKQKAKYQKAVEIYEGILEEQESLFTRTQPNAITYDKDKVNSSNQSNVLEEYMIAREKKMIDKRLKDAKEMMCERKYQLKAIETELRESKEHIDVVYVYRFLESMHQQEIADIMNYSKSQVCRILQKIEKC